MQPFDVFLSEAALTDLEDIVEYYNEKLSGLGFRFFRQAEASLRRIADNPSIFSRRYQDVRCARVRKFPFLIHFNLDVANNSVFILAVFSTHQKPLWES